MNDRLHNLIIGVFNEGFERDSKECEKVREEIKQRGTWWAGTEIWELRRTVASLRKRLKENENGND
jgi:hypothetical protein